MVILCTIDLETREVSLPAGQVIASYDHNVDVIRFQAETIPGFSLNTSSIKIAAQGPNKARHDYAVDPSTVAIEEETGYITFDWPIPAGVTEMPIGSGFKYGDRGQLIFAVCAEIISGDTVSKAWHSDDGIITVVAHLEPESGGGEDPEEEATNAQKIAQLQTNVAVMGTQIGALANGSPTPVATVAEMTDESAVYLYTGSETGYTAGNWYYYNGTAWTSGGVYGGATTSTTFNQHGVPADDYATGQALALKADSANVTALDTRVTSVEGAEETAKERLDDIEQALFKTFNYDESTTRSIAVRDFYDTTKIIDVDIPANQPFTIKLTSDATRGGNTTLRARYSDTTSAVLSYNATYGTDLTYTKDKDIVDFEMQVAGDGFTSAGTLNVSVSYARHNENSVEEQLETLFTDKANADDLTALGTRVTAVETGLDGKADSSDVTALDTRVTAAEGEVDTFDGRIETIEESLYKTITHEESVAREIAVGDFKSTAEILAIDVPANQAFTVRLSTDATHGNIAMHVDYSDNTSATLTYNAALDTDLTHTKDKAIIRFKIQVSGGFTSTGTLSFSVSYTRQTENSVEEQLENLTADISTVQDDFDIIYHDYLVETGYDLITEWVSGDIDSNGNEISSGSYYRTNKVNVDASKTYYLAQVTQDSEGTTKVIAWGNNTYGVIHCYSDSAYLGTATDGTGNNAGIFTPLANTTKVCISHVYQNSTNIHMYELNSEDDRHSIIPTGHDDVYEKSFDSASMTRTKVSSDQIDFTANDGTTLVTKETASPWFVWSNYLISDYIPFNSGTYYIKCVISGMTGMYIRFYDNNKEPISSISLGNYQTATRFNAPNGTKYIKVTVGKSTPKLSDLTTMEIYTFTSRSVGYTPMHDVIDVNVLPTLPPTATTGKSGSGIICLGHGGLSSVYAEDSIESFYGLAHCGFDGSEVDIQFTKDNVPVCWHDGSLGSLEGGTSSDHIWDYTLAELDANFDFRTWWDKRNCFRSTIARFEEVCILARAYGWYIIPDKCLGLEADRAVNMQAVIDLVKKYNIQDKFIPANSFTEFRQAFPDNEFSLTAMQTAVDETWINGLLNNVIPDLCHQDSSGNMIVNDGVIVSTSFNWQAIKTANGVEKCAEITDLMTAHNVKTTWYTCETPEDIYQLVKYCPKTAFLLTGLYTVPDGVNAYLGIGQGNSKYDLSRTVHL